MSGPIDFQNVFDRIPSPYMMLDRDLRFAAANRAYLKAVELRWEDIAGRYVFDAFPVEGESRRTLEESLARARDTGQVDVLPLIEYAIQRPTLLGGGSEARTWSATHTPILDARGHTIFILQHTQDVTELQRLKDVAFGGRAPSAVTMLGGDILQRAETVQAQSLQLRRLFMQAPSFMAILRGPDHVFELINNTYLQLIGHRDVVGLPMREALPEVVEQGFPDLLDKVRSSAEAFVGRQIKIALQRTPDGPLEDRYLDFVYQPIIEDDGSVSGVFVEGFDISDQVQAQDQQRLLLDELNHRVKNTLATVQAISQQTLRGASDPAAFAKAFEARLLALSQTHNALTDGQWSGAGLRQILNLELLPHGAERVSLDGPDAHLPARTALSLGMVFHELTTNAAKYGALAQDGRLSVHWQGEGDGLAFTWHEAGGPTVAPPTRRGFGSRLIERSITSELRGRFAIDYRPEGVLCEFWVPVAVA
ncbi:sensor histidine kinase [Caulobacter sp. DWR2-3-1b2]|uniref:sensor histidine kinase n=1 Tax=unclassified Caulobacter TaxID=2648921 RepID=UPI0019C620A7|nr:PAS domain-containing protein [Caulobacter sp.]